MFEAVCVSALLGYLEALKWSMFDFVDGLVVWRASEIAVLG